MARSSCWTPGSAAARFRHVIPPAPAGYDQAAGNLPGPGGLANRFGQNVMACL